VNSYLEIDVVEPEIYLVKAVEGHVVTGHAVQVSSEVLAKIGLIDAAGEIVVNEVFGILHEREALTAVPANATLEQLTELYPYLLSELQENLAPGQALPAGPVRVAPLPAPAPNRPTHT
jgi:hypothetical protein